MNFGICEYFYNDNAFYFQLSNSRNRVFQSEEKILPYQHPDTDDPRMLQEDVDRVQEFRKCIECFLCQDVCHVLRDSDMKSEYAGPRFLMRNAMLEMHPLDQGNRLETIKNDNGIGLCNITKCCTEVCPENIAITDNAINFKIRC